MDGVTEAVTEAGHDWGGVTSAPSDISHPAEGSSDSGDLRSALLLSSFQTTLYKF